MQNHILRGKEKARVDYQKLDPFKKKTIKNLERITVLTVAMIFKVCSKIQ